MPRPRLRMLSTYLGLGHNLVEPFWAWFFFYTFNNEQQIAYSCLPKVFFRTLFAGKCGENNENVNASRQKRV